MSSTSDSVHFGEGPSHVTPAASDYSWWRNHLTPEQGLAWGALTQGMSTKERISLFQGMLQPGKSAISRDNGLILARPLTKTADFGPTDVFVCQQWAQNSRKKLVFLPESGFCALVAIVRSLE